MARKTKGSATITTSDVAWGFGGALAGILVNPLINAGIKSYNENTQEMIKKGAVVAKAAGGGYVAINKKMSRESRFFGLGFGGVGVIETGFKFMPQNFKILGANDGTDVFTIIGNSNTVKLPIAPSTAMQSGELYDDGQLLGMDAAYQGMPML